MYLTKEKKKIFWDILSFFFNVNFFLHDPEKDFFFKEIVIVFEEICKNYPRELWFSTVEDARQLGITKIDSFICDPFKVDTC